jgi:hypothetical protein
MPAFLSYRTAKPPTQFLDGGCRQVETPAHRLQLGALRRREVAEFRQAAGGCFYSLPVAPRLDSAVPATSSLAAGGRPAITGRWRMAAPFRFRARRGCDE